MKTCPVCGIEYPLNAPYCPQCGTATQLMKTTPMLTDNKGLDALVGFAISIGLLFGSGILLGILATLGMTLAWLYVVPFVVTLLATIAAYRRFRFVAYGMLIPLLIILLVALGIFLLCGGIH